MSRFIYNKNRQYTISFPVGGLGTGCIGIAGNGRLVDWEIFNRPNKGSINSLTHFAIKAETTERVLDARVLHGDLSMPYYGEVRRDFLAGVPHFKEVVFKGEFPFAALDFVDDSFPGKVSMEVFNPFIPLNDKDSSIPAAFFEMEVSNNTFQEVTYSICASIANPHVKCSSHNEYVIRDGMHFINLLPVGLNESEPEYGELTIATDGSNISYQKYWYRGAWFDNLTVFWDDFTAFGPLINREYDHLRPANSMQDLAALAVTLKLEAGESKKVKFILTWNYPNSYNYWSGTGCSVTDLKYDKIDRTPWKNYYTSLFENSMDSAVYSLTNWKRLYEETRMFKEALFSTSLPESCIDAISANISILKSPTCLRLEDGSFYGWEGCGVTSGACEGSCTHVWNYAYALPFLFPSLERSMRDLDFKYNMDEHGGMEFRLRLPPGSRGERFHSCVDGLFGGVIKVYRDWKISGDNDWLNKHWDSVKKNMAYAWSENNPDRWDMDRDGVIKGRQHHTLDMELFGANSWLTGFYLAALKAAAEIAEFLGELEPQEEYLRLFKQGKQWVDENLFNGEYYCQKIDLKDRSIIERFNASEIYWNDEAQEIKYQIHTGCMIDQVIAQWHANLCGLGDIFEKEKRLSALKSIYKYNFKKEMRNYFNACRVFSLNEEAGVVICNWPDRSSKPAIPLTYAQETMNGFEYQVAAHMIQEGMVEEGIGIISAVRNRYTGDNRNPWAEVECGSNYARSMASYSILNAFSGFKYDMPGKKIGFSPVKYFNGVFKSFWSVGSGWGNVEFDGGVVRLFVLYGSLAIDRISIPHVQEVIDVELEGKTMDFSVEEDSIIFGEEVRMENDNCLLIVKGSIPQKTYT